MAASADLRPFLLHVHEVFSDGDVHSYFNPYGTPYDAYINYMNVLADFRLTLDAASPLDPGTKSAVLESA